MVQRPRRKHDRALPACLNAPVALGIVRRADGPDRAGISRAPSFQRTRTRRTQIYGIPSRRERRTKRPAAVGLAAHDPRPAPRAQTAPAPMPRHSTPLQAQPRPRAQPPQSLARTVDVRASARRHTNQQPRRARPPRRRHLPQTLPRQPIPRRRTTHRTTPLRLDHLPPPTTIALHLPRRTPQQPRPRRPPTTTRLTSPTPRN